MRVIICANKKRGIFDRDIFLENLKMFRKSGIREVGYLDPPERSLDVINEYQKQPALEIKSLNAPEDGEFWKGEEAYLAVYADCPVDETMIQKIILSEMNCMVMGEKRFSSGEGQVLVFKKKIMGILPDTCKKDSVVFVPAVKMSKACAQSALQLLKNGYDLEEAVNRLLKMYEFAYAEYQKPVRAYGGITADNWKDVLDQTLKKYRPCHALWLCDIPETDREFHEWNELYKCCFDGKNPLLIFAVGSIKILEKGMEYQDQTARTQNFRPILILLPTGDALDGLYHSLKKWKCQVENVFLCTDLWMMTEKIHREQCFYQALCKNMSALLSDSLDEEHENACIQATKKLLSCYYYQNNAVHAGKLFKAIAAAEECSESVEQLQLLADSLDESVEYSQKVQKRVSKAYSTADFQTAVKRYRFILNILDFPQKSADASEEKLNAFRGRVLEILEDVQFFCRQKKIACFLADATLLGAWRNGRWIPWSDNTIRLYMPRPSYDRFLKHAAGGLKRKYRLDTVSLIDSKIFLGTRVILDDSRYESEFWPGTKKIKYPHVEIMPYETVDRSDDFFVKNVLSDLNRKIAEFQKDEKKKNNAAVIGDYMRSLNKEEGSMLLFWDFDFSRGAYLIEQKMLQKKSNICFCGLECRVFKNAEILLRKRYGNATAALPGAKKNISACYAQAELPKVEIRCQKNRQKFHTGVTVIVPVYNTKRYLNRCLLSLVNQTIEKLEILVIDDGSTDGSAELLDQWQEEYPELIRVIHQKNTGVSRARMRGIQEASETYLGFVDSDDYVEQNMYELLVEKAEDEQSDVVVCRYYRENDEDGSFYVPGKWNSWLYGKSVEESPGILLTARPFSCTKLFRKDFVIKNQLEFPAFRLGEDSAFVVPALILASRVSIVDEALYHYAVDRQDSALHSYRDQRLLEVFDACDYMIDRCRTLGKWELLESELTEYLRRVLAARFHILKEIEDDGFVKTFIGNVFHYMDKKLPKWNQTEYYQNACEEEAASDDPYDLAKLTKEGMETYFFGEKPAGFWKKLFKDRCRI